MQQNLNTSSYWVYGKHVIVSLLSNKKRKCHKLLLTKEAYSFLSQRKLITNNEPIIIIENKEIEKVLKNSLAIHQGFAALTSPIPRLSLDQAIKKLSKKPKSLIIALDQITDPHNIGAITRSAAAFNVDAIIITKSHCRIDSAIVEKTSSGAMDIIDFIEVTNLFQTIEILKDNGFWAIGLNNTVSQYLKEANKFEKKLLILGAEGKGLRKLTLKTCDLMVKIPINPKIDSLNVSNAAAIAIYELNS